MSEKYDIVVAGAGHNGLIAGAYMAKAGLSVCVVEKQPYVGGGVVTRELTIPGFKHDVCSAAHMMMQTNPLIRNDELKLMSKYGLKYIQPEESCSILFPDDRYMAFYKDLDKTCESIAQFSEKDAEAYRKFAEWGLNTLDFLMQGMFVPPPSLGAMMSMLDQSPEGREIMRAFTISVMDICDEWFESPEMKIALTRMVSEQMLSPQTKGTSIILFIYVPISHKYGFCIPEGGSGTLSEALRACIEDHGGVVRTSSPIKKFNVSGGECSGIVLESGEEFLASKAVVTNFNIKQIPGMVEETNLPADYVRNIKRLQLSEYAPFHLELALNEAPKYKDPKMTPGESYFMEFTDSYDMVDYLRSYDDLVYGIPNTRNPLVICPTIWDKTRAPEGKHTLYVYHYAPYNLREGGPERWDNIKDKFVEDVIETIRARTTNMNSDNILGSWAMSPLDYARYNPSWPCGDFCHFSLSFTQAFGNRPVPDWGYKTPIKKLYICGPSTHPGWSVNGAARAAMWVIMEDLGIDFEKLVSS